MIKQVVVRGDERIVAELIASADQQRIPVSEPVSNTPALVSAAVGADGEVDYSLKNRIGKTIADEEKRIIGEVLARTNWNRRKAAEILQISYRSLLYKIKDYKLNASD